MSTSTHLVCTTQVSLKYVISCDLHIKNCGSKQAHHKKTKPLYNFPEKNTRLNKVVTLPPKNYLPE
jgi:hypothetical protein